MMKICAFIWLTLKYILVILVDVKVIAPYIQFTYLPPEVPFRGIFLPRLSQKQVFDLGDRGINDGFRGGAWKPIVSSAELNSACGVNSGKNSPNPLFPFSLFSIKV